MYVYTYIVIYNYSLTYNHDCLFFQWIPGSTINVLLWFLMHIDKISLKCSHDL